jgi:hypothetical protein
MVMNSLFMNIRRLMNTSYTEIQLQTIYLCTQLVIKLDNDRKKDTTSPDRNADSKMDNLQLGMSMFEIFFHIS